MAEVDHWILCLFSEEGVTQGDNAVMGYYVCSMTQGDNAAMGYYAYSMTQGDNAAMG